MLVVKKDKEAEMIEKLRRIEGEIIERKRARRVAISLGQDVSDLDKGLNNDKIAAARIRKHLREGAYV